MLETFLYLLGLAATATAGLLGMLAARRWGAEAERRRLASAGEEEAARQLIRAAAQSQVAVRRIQMWAGDDVEAAVFIVRQPEALARFLMVYHQLAAAARETRREVLQ